MINATEKQFLKKIENRHRGRKKFPDNSRCFVVLSVGGSMHNLLSMRRSLCHSAANVNDNLVSLGIKLWF